MRLLVRWMGLAVFSLGLAIALAPWGAASFPQGAIAPDPPMRISEIEQTWLSDYGQYLGDASETAVLTPEAIDATLSRITEETEQSIALLYLVPEPTALELVMVIPHQPLIYKTLPDVPRSRLMAKVEEFQSEVTRPGGGRRYLPAAQQLYQWLIAPLEEELRSHSIDSLVLCVGEGLRSLPFAALHDGQQFLMETYNLGLIPAFSLTNSAYERLGAGRVLAMGASEFPTLADLPAVPLELSTIDQTHWRSTIFLNHRFTLENLERQLETGEYQIVHLATHAAFQPGAPDRSVIQLWQRETLNLVELQQLNWRALPVELLVLSACQTALGDRQAELGFAGLSFQAGVKSSLASLWYVSDVGTLALMREFYWQLADPQVKTKAEALRRAQQAMVTGTVRVEDQRLWGSAGPLPLPDTVTRSPQIDFSSPYYWAAFTLVGSPW